MEFKFKNFNVNNYLPKFLEGGGMAAPVEDTAPADEPVGAPAGGADPMQQLIEMFAQGLQNQDCNLLAQAAQAFLQAVGGGAPAAPEGAAPVYKRGGKFSHWVNK